jgi:hypothetical protein
VILPALECHTAISQHLPSPLVTGRPGGSTFRPLTIIFITVLMNDMKKYEI